MECAYILQNKYFGIKLKTMKSKEETMNKMYALGSINSLEIYLPLILLTEVIKKTVCKTSTMAFQSLSLLLNF